MMLRHMTEHNCLRWRLPEFMPRVYSRILLRVLGIRQERLQDISEEDLYREGAFQYNRFAFLWNETYQGTEFSWSFNPLVWVVNFERAS